MCRQNFVRLDLVLVGVDDRDGGTLARSVLDALLSPQDFIERPWDCALAIPEIDQKHDSVSCDVRCQVFLELRDWRIAGHSAVPIQLAVDQDAREARRESAAGQYVIGSDRFGTPIWVLGSEGVEEHHLTVSGARCSRLSHIPPSWLIDPQLTCLSSVLRNRSVS